MVRKIEDGLDLSWFEQDFNRADSGQRRFAELVTRNPGVAEDCRPHTV
jgi:hypothetical protein